MSSVLSETKASGLLNGTLNSFGLDWQYCDVAQPNLVFMLSAVDGAPVSHDKTLFNINLHTPLSPATPLPSSSLPSPPPPLPRASIELIAQESVLRAIPLPRVISCEPTLSDPHTLQVVHLSSPTPRRRADKPSAPSTCAVLSLTFPSLEDATDVATVLRALIHCASSTSSAASSPSASPLLSRTIHGQVCIHQGWVEKRSSTSLSYARRFVRLFPNRLLLYRTAASAYPVNVFPLTVDDVESHALVTAPKPRTVEINLRSMWGGDGREGLTWRTATAEEQSRWTNAIAVEQTASFRTRIGAIITPQLRAALAGGGADTGDGSAASSRRGSVSSAPPLPPLPHPALTAVALSITATAAGRPSSNSLLQSPTHRMSRDGSISTSFAGNPLLDSNSSPKQSPPLGASLFVSSGGPAQLPAIHLGSVGSSGQSPPLSLSSLLSSPRSFFHYLLHLSSLPLLWPSALPSPQSWHRLTPQPFLKKRGKLMLAIDSALSSYHALLSASSALWAEARLVMVDELEQSGSGQIGFSFPGFDAQVFDVGKLSVIACHQLFAPSAHALLFTKKDYEGAIESSSPAKEMMQSSPDITALFDAGQMDEARTLSFQAQRLVLHHCALAAHLKTKTSTSGRYTLRANEVIPWSAVVHTAFAPPPSSSSAAPSTKNQAVLESFSATAYIANPSLHTLQLLLTHSMTEGAAAVGMAVGQRWDAPFSSAPVSPHGSPDGSPLSMPSSPRLGASAHRRGLKELWHARRGSETAAKVLKDAQGRDRAGSHHAHTAAKAKAKPTGKVTPPAGSNRSTPSHSPPSSSRDGSVVGSMSGALNLALPEEVADVRPLVNPLHLLLLLRCLLLSRVNGLVAIDAAASEWWKKRRGERGLSDADQQRSDDKGERMDSVEALLRRVEEERAKADAALAVLPDYEELERQRELQDREDRDAIARNALIRRRILETKAREDDRRHLTDDEPSPSPLPSPILLDPPSTPHLDESSKSTPSGRDRDGSDSAVSDPGVSSSGSDAEVHAQVPPATEAVAARRGGGVLVSARLATFERRLSAGSK